MRTDIETMERNDRATLWVANGVNDYSEPTVSEPVEIDVRWESRRGERGDAQGNVVVYDAVVVVDRVIPIQSILRLGTIADYRASDTDDLLLYSVVDFSGIPDLKGRNTRRLAYCKRYSNQLPEIADRVYG